MKVIINALHLSLFLLLATFAMAEGMIPFQLKNGLILIEAEVDNKVGTYVFDTGSSDLLIHSNSPVSGASFSTSSGTVQAKKHKVKKITVGKLSARKVKAYKMDLSSVSEYLALDIDGIMSGSVLSSKGVYIDYTSHTIYFVDRKEVNTESFNHMSYSIIEDVPVANVKIGEKAYSFILDSGASTHFIDAAVVGELSLKASSAGSDIVTAHSDAQAGKSYAINNCTLGTASMENMNVLSGSFSHLIEGESIAGLISISTLAKEKIFIDFSDKKLYFK